MWEGRSEPGSQWADSDDGQGTVPGCWQGSKSQGFVIGYCTLLGTSRKEHLWAAHASRTVLSGTHWCYWLLGTVSPVTELTGHLQYCPSMRWLLAYPDTGSSRGG